MMHRFLRWFKPPVFESEPQTLRAAQIHTISSFLGICVLGYLALMMTNLPLLAERRMWLVVSVIPIYLLLIQALNRAGRVQSAAIVLVLGMALIVNGASLSWGGVHSIGYMANTLVILCAGLLLGRRWSLTMLVLAVLVGGGLLLADVSNVPWVNHNAMEASSTLITVSLMFLAILGLLEVALRWINQSLSRAIASEARYRHLFDDAPGGLVVVDPTLKIMILNASAAQMLGYAIDELKGTDGRRLLADLATSPLPPRLEPRMFVEQPRLLQERLLRRRDGTVLTVLTVLHALDDDSYLATLIDITERQQMEQALREKEQLLETIFEATPYSMLINRVGDDEYVKVNQAFSEYLELPAAKSLGLTELRHFINQRMLSDDIRDAMAASLAAASSLDRVEVKMLDNQDSVRYAWLTSRVFSLDEVQHVLTIVQDVTEHKLAEQALEDSYELTLEGWAKALELREHETAGHSRRVVELTLRLALRVGVPSDDLINICRGALLHDIGKLGIPDAVLLKPEPLTPEEWGVMRLHPLYSYQLLARIPFLVPALDIPYCHHERWDGNGYPRALSGTEIPLAARLFSIVDVWDALTSNRPYRPALPHEEALAVIARGAGVLFDPDLVPLFVQMIREDLALLPLAMHIDDAHPFKHS